MKKRKLLRKTCFLVKKKMGLLFRMNINNEKNENNCNFIWLIGNVYVSLEYRKIDNNNFKKHKK